MLVMACEQVAVGLPVLGRHEHVYDGVGAGAQVDQEVAQHVPELVGWVPHNLKPKTIISLICISHQKVFYNVDLCANRGFVTISLMSKLISNLDNSDG